MQRISSMYGQKLLSKTISEPTHHEKEGCAYTGPICKACECVCENACKDVQAPPHKYVGGIDKAKGMCHAKYVCTNVHSKHE